MVRIVPFFAGMALFAALPADVSAQGAPTCQLCGPATPAAAAAPAKALNVRIDSELTFGVAAIGPNGAGMIAIDPRTDLRVVSGGLIDLGGLAFSGVVRLSGQPLSRVRITLPSSETMNTAGGGKARIMGFATDLPANSMLDVNGNLQFHFAGRFSVSGGEIGDFRGRVTISADYN